MISPEKDISRHLSSCTPNILQVSQKYFVKSTHCMINSFHGILSFSLDSNAKIRDSLTTPNSSTWNATSSSSLKLSGLDFLSKHVH